MDSDCVKYVWKKIITIYPSILDDQSILLNSLMSWVRVRAHTRFWQRLRRILANRQNNPLSKHHWHKDCLNSVNSESINYTFLTCWHWCQLWPTQWQCRDTLLCLFLATRVLRSQRRRVYFSSLLLHHPLFSLIFFFGGCHHLLLGISQQVLSLSTPCSIPLEKSGDNARLSGRGGGGETGSL